MAGIPPKYPLLQYLKIEQKHVSQIEAILKRAASENSAAILAAETAGKNPLTILQLRAQGAAIKANLAQNWKKIERAIDLGQRAAAAEASRVVSEYEKILLGGIISEAELADFIASQAAQASAGVRTLMDRLGGSIKPLSDAVYGTKNLVNGQVDRAINVALARGMNARDFAAYMRDFISPTTPGGASYAAKRLARTEINNAYHHSTNERYKNDPIVEGVDWHLSNSHPTPDLCNDYETNSPYKPADVPDKPHPQCLCYTTPALPNREQFIEKLFNGDYGDEPWIDLAQPGAPDLPAAPKNPFA